MTRNEVVQKRLASLTVADYELATCKVNPFSE